MQNNEKLIARLLLQIKAIKLNPAKPFTWASGWLSPIYCDNRITLSYPHVRSVIRDEYVRIIKSNYPDIEAVTGVATGAIAQGALVAGELALPFAYVRSAQKEHGLKNLIEGELSVNQKVVVIEDLVSTGGSSLKAVNALREAGCVVLGLVAIFSYNFDIAVENFSKAGCELNTLCNYSILLEEALETGYINEKDVPLLNQWRENPGVWGK
jgi:orotate phosphoribosyltransferase